MGAGVASALDTVGACLPNRLRDCLLAMGSEEQERFGWTGASWARAILKMAMGMIPRTAYTILMLTVKPRGMANR